MFFAIFNFFFSLVFVDVIYIYGIRTNFYKDWLDTVLVTYNIVQVILFLVAICYGMWITRKLPPQS